MMREGLGIDEAEAKGLGDWEVEGEAVEAKVYGLQTALFGCLLSC